MAAPDLIAAWRPRPEGVWGAVKKRLQRIAAALFYRAICCFRRRLPCLRLVLCRAAGLLGTKVIAYCSDLVRHPDRKHGACPLNMTHKSVRHQ